MTDIDQMQAEQMEDPVSISKGARGATLGFVFGIVIGAAAGLIGVGGGEFRIPVLLHVLRLPVKLAAAANLVIGLLTVMLGVARRWGQQSFTPSDLALAAVMAAASLAGAVLGARQADRLSSSLLRRLVVAYLLVVGVWMIFEAFTGADHVLTDPRGPARWAMAAVVGFLIAAVSGALGVAGGEMRIPALLYLFGVPIKLAGTLSLMVSIPTVAAGAVTYRRLGHLPGRVFQLALTMGAGSLIGVLVGASLLPSVDRHTVKGLLGLVLLLATIGMTVRGSSWLRPQPSGR